MTCIETFGVERSFFGTNWPVDRLFSSYVDVLDAYEAIIAGFSPDEQVALLSGNAERIFRYSAQGPPGPGQLAHFIQGRSSLGGSQLAMGAWRGSSIQQNRPFVSPPASEVSRRTSATAFSGGSPPVSSTQSAQEM